MDKFGVPDSNWYRGIKAGTVVKATSNEGWVYFFVLKDHEQFNPANMSINESLSVVDSKGNYITIPLERITEVYDLHDPKAFDLNLLSNVQKHAIALFINGDIGAP